LAETKEKKRERDGGAGKEGRRGREGNDKGPPLVSGIFCKINPPLVRY